MKPEYGVINIKFSLGVIKEGNNFSFVWELLEKETTSVFRPKVVAFWKVDALNFRKASILVTFWKGINFNYATHDHKMLIYS